MSQHDYNIANQTGLEFRADLNEVLQAIVTQNSGATEPAITYAGMKWLDTSTSPPIEKRRNAANSVWETTLTEAGRAVAGAANAAAQLTAMGAQATLVSGTNIKTINGESVLGSGNVVISAGLAAASTAEAQGGTSNTVAITPVRMKEAQIQQSNVVTLTSGVAVDFLSIPAWAKRITVMFSGVRTDGASQIIVRLGTSGGVQNSGYFGNASIVGVSTVPFATGFGIESEGLAGITRVGIMDIRLLGNNEWCATFTGARTDYAFMLLGSGTKTLGALLTRVQVTTVNGTDTFTAGNVSVSWE